MPKCWKCGSIESYASGIQEGLCLDCWCGVLNKYLKKHYGPGAVDRAIADAGNEARWCREKKMEMVEQEQQNIPEPNPEPKPGSNRKPSKKTKKKKADKTGQSEKMTKAELLDAVRWIREMAKSLVEEKASQELARIRLYIQQYPGSRFVMGKKARGILDDMGIVFRRGEVTVNKNMKDSTMYLLARGDGGKFIWEDGQRFVSPYIKVLDMSKLNREMEETR